MGILGAVVVFGPRNGFAFLTTDDRLMRSVVSAFLRLPMIGKCCGGSSVRMFDYQKCSVD